MPDIFQTYIFNVGHGDNILIKFSTNTWGLIDFHFTDFHSEPPSLTHLKSLEGDIVIEFLHITHFHQDHTKGLDQFFSWLEEPKNKGRVTLKNLWLPGISPTEKMQKIIHELRTNTEVILEAWTNDTLNELTTFEYQFSFLDGKIEEHQKEGTLRCLTSCKPIDVNAEYSTLCLSPSSETISKIFSTLSAYLKSFVEGIVRKQAFIDQNTLSTILVFTRPHNWCSGIKFAFGGDATEKDWTSALADYQQTKRGLAVDLQDIYSAFIKASHHGSQHSSSSLIWGSLVKPSSKDAVHTFFSSGSMKYPNTNTLLHIQYVAVQTQSNIQIHATNQPAGSPNHKTQKYPVQLVSNASGAARAGQVGRSRQKIPVSGSLVAFRYDYDFLRKKAEVTQLLVP